LEFEDPLLAAECFVELRHKVQVGLDYDILAISSNQELDLTYGYYLLGKDLKEFKEKYSNVKEVG
jgi:hypothetical protein